MQVALIGMMGCGKSSVGRRMAEILGCPFADLDEEVEKKAGKSIPAIFSGCGEKGFRTIEYECLKKLHTYSIISCGGGTPTYPESCKYLKDNFICIYLKATEEALVEHIKSLPKGYSDRPMLYGHEIVSRIHDLSSSREDTYRKTADVVIDCGNKTVDEIAAEAVESLRHFNFGLIGFPIKHSLSPALFHSAYGDKYAYDLIECNSFETGLNLFRQRYLAVNVTAPFKQDALNAADCPDKLSTLAEACNILVWKNGVIHGYNSDVMAVERLIENHTADKIVGCRHIGSDNNGKVLVIGCGGAGRAAAAAALSLGKEIIVINRSADKAESFAQNICGENPEMGRRIEIRSEATLSQSVSKSGIIIFTLPCPMPVLNRILEDSGTGDKTVIEANYRAPNLKDIPARHKYVCGEEWLLMQAVEGYGLMTGRKPDENRMRAACLSSKADTSVSSVRTSPEPEQTPGDKN